MLPCGSLAESPVELPGISIIQSTAVMFADVSGGSVLYKDNDLYRVEWEAEDEDDDDMEEHTTLSKIIDTAQAELPLNITDLQGRRSTLKLRLEDTPYNVGRNPERCQLIVSAGFVSREHCHSDYQHGSFILRDHSSNGTHVIMSRHQPVYLRRNSAPLLGEGIIGAGHDPNEAGHHVIDFKV